MSKTITMLNTNRVALVDDEDHPWLVRFDWYLHGVTRPTQYAVSSGHRGVLMHHMILPLQLPLITHHKDGDGLNNQRYNLVRATRFENAQHHKQYNTNTSGVNGVHYSVRDRMWMVHIVVNGRRTTRSFATKEEAIEARNRNVQNNSDAEHS